MTCPRCASAILEHQRFCSACGVTLSSSQGAAVEEELSALDTLEKLNDRRERLLRVGLLITMLSLIVGSCIPVIVGLEAYLPDHDNLIVVLAGVTGIILFTGSAMLCYGGMLPEKPKKRSLPAAPTTNELEPPASHAAQLNAPPASVTEHTTRSLEPSSEDRR